MNKDFLDGWTAAMMAVGILLVICWIFKIGLYTPCG